MMEDSREVGVDSGTFEPLQPPILSNFWTSKISTAIGAFASRRIATWSGISPGFGNICLKLFGTDGQE